MRILFLVLLLFFIRAGCSGQSFLLFRKNGHREAHYYVGDVLSFSVIGDKRKFSDRIIGFENNLIVFHYFQLNAREIDYLYVDDKTKIWYITRYKYDKLFPILGGGLIAVDSINTGKFHQRALGIGGGLLGAGLAAKWLISKRIKIKGKRKLVVVSE